MKGTGDAGARGFETSLRKFLHELSAPLSALALALDSASRAASRGEDPSEALALAQRALQSAFEKFDQGRTALLGEPPGGRIGSAT